MAKGQLSKAEFSKKILSVYEDAFLYNDGKEIRVPFVEDGINIQLKITMTCAKDIVEPGADNALPTPITKGGSVKAGEFSFPEPQKIEVTDNEKTAVQDLMSSLGL